MEVHPTGGLARQVRTLDISVAQIAVATKPSSQGAILANGEGLCCTTFTHHICARQVESQNKTRCRACGDKRRITEVNSKSIGSWSKSARSEDEPWQIFQPAFVGVQNVAVPIVKNHVVSREIQIVPGCVEVNR